ncbi:MAG: type Z 30S ribosomal protein S14 [Chloroflexi bacterium]|nr:MAG: type Z 30S ribosomal protein S14 [Chloroflexota bacterium]TMD55283.1 MAG: type Z 30S ribosomal protein S14 [Chloroflexota bacterium]
MAKKSAIESWKAPAKYKTRFHNRCRLCGRPRGYMRQFGMCRICFRNLAAEGRIPGVTKSSW